MATEVHASDNIPDSEVPELASKEEEIVVSNENQEHSPELEQDDSKVFLDLFKNFDTQKKGTIKAENMHEIATMLGKNKNDVDEILKNNGKSKGDSLTLEEYQLMIAELDRPNISALESDRSRQSQKIVITPDTKVVEFIRLLYAFQIKCEAEAKYGEAKLAQEKIEDIKIKEILRQENSIRAFQEEELAQVENAQKEQFIEFNRVWDNYMSEYEVTALASLDKLKEKHIKEVEELHQRLKRDLAFHFKSSKNLIELRQKEVALAKMKKYGEAEKIKAQADALEEWERNNKEKEIEEIIDKKTLALRKQQQRGLSVLLKRIQKDRNQQLKNREVDSQKLVLKNKNLRNELIAKHATEAKNALEVIRNNMSVVNAAQSLKAKSPTMIPTHRTEGKNE